MMNLTPLEIILVLSTLLEFNPLFQAFKSIRTKKVDDISPYTFVSILIIGLLWFWYGFTISSIPLIIGNAIKLLTSLFVLAVYFKYKNR
jgi:uncharacterized protein with PQ loop repeat